MYFLINKFTPANGNSDDDLLDLVNGTIRSENPETPANLNNEIEYDTNRGNNFI